MSRRDFPLRTAAVRGCFQLVRLGGHFPAASLQSLREGRPSFLRTLTRAGIPPSTFRAAPGGVGDLRCGCLHALLLCERAAVTGVSRRAFVDAGLVAGADSSWMDCYGISYARSLVLVFLFFFVKKKNPPLNNSDSREVVAEWSSSGILLIVVLTVLQF